MRLVHLAGDDVNRFLAFRLQGFAGDPNAFRYIAADDDAIGDTGWRERLQRDLVAAVERGDELLGIGGFSRFPGAKLDHKGLIWGMYVAPAARGSGVADRLLSSLIEHARGCVRQLQLTVMADNVRARAFYERHGFKLYAIETASVRCERGFADEALMWRLV